MQEAFLRANSRLPGPRANLELLMAAGDQIEPQLALEWAARPIGAGPTDVFIVMVGLVGLGRRAGLGDEVGLPLLRQRAGDEEWRIREAVAMGLQRLGDERPQRLAEVAFEWVGGTPLEARAAVAAVAEPRLLKNEPAIEQALDVLDVATQKAVDSRDRVLRQALGYAWSVVVAADPARGLPRFEAWEAKAAGDARLDWMVRENRAKSRMKKLLR